MSGLVDVEDESWILFGLQRYIPCICIAFFFWIMFRYSFTVRTTPFVLGAALLGYKLDLAPTLVGFLIFLRIS